MIVYGFYGTGKSTVCEQNKAFYDFDFRHFLFGYRDIDPNEIDFAKIEAEYALQAKLKDKDFDVVFINHHVPNLIDLAFIQDSYQTCLTTLEGRQQGNFVPTEDEFNLEKENVSSVPNIIILTEGSYISSHMNILKGDLNGLHTD